MNAKERAAGLRGWSLLKARARKNNTGRVLSRETNPHILAIIPTPARYRIMEQGAIYLIDHAGNIDYLTPVRAH